MDCNKTVTRSGTPIKLLIGGSPCTKWSIAQKNGREVLPEGIGWELFENYRIAKEKFQPDIFLYENNKSAAQPIKDAIYSALGGGKDSSVRLTHIDSALVSAQHRQRFYVTNFGDIEQPEDRGILLRNVLESGKDLSCREKAYTLTASYGGAVAWNPLERNQRTMVAEPVCVESAVGESIQKMIPAVVDRLGYLPEKFNAYNRTEIKDKSPSLTTGSMVTSSCATTILEPIRIGTIESNAKNKSHDSKQYRVYSPDGKATTLCGQGGGIGAKTGLYAAPVGGKVKELPVYEVRDGLITIKDKQYPIELADGYYLIRKLTPTECERLQTMPDGYTAAVSNSQRYKALGKGWTAEVIIHILNHALRDVPKDKELVVFSMYDGIATGRYCLDKMGFTNVKYYAYEIDPYAIKIAMSNYPDIVQCGDAFQIRNF
jgi:DNA (cytosine-5)-methyltransferase 3A|nr:MAG TPA: Cytosine specific methyltransferase [Caudoviricetes sp.]